MENLTERTVGHLFGLIGGALIIVGAVIAAAFGVADLLLGHAFAAMGAWGEAVVLGVVGALVLLFAYLGEHDWTSKPVVSGVLLVLLALISWAVLGLGVNVLALVGGIFALLAGALYLIEPSQRAFHAVASAA
jgi:hypothetical protein